MMKFKKNEACDYIFHAQILFAQNIKTLQVKLNCIL